MATVGEWEVTQPLADELIAALIPPLQLKNGVCSGRLWLPRGEAWRNVDYRSIISLEQKPNGAHQLAMCAHYEAFLGNEDRAQLLMKEAKKWFYTPDRDTRVHCPFKSRHLLSKILALDWIVWSDAQEFEEAFILVKKQLTQSIQENLEQGVHFRKQGYWNATHTIQTPYFLEEFLCLIACKLINESESDKWARNRLSALDTGENSEPLYSTFKFANVLSILSRRGGGREYGQNEGNPGIGGYEQYFAAGGLVQLEAVDTATDRKWKLRERNLYLRTRYLGLLTEIDRSVARTANSPFGDAFVATLARIYREEAEVGGIYQWCLGSTSVPAEFREFQALAGSPPAPQPPAATPLVDRVGSRWHYRENPARPDSTFRMWIVNRDLANFRIGPDERCLSFCVGEIGLVDGHANRTHINGALANGVHLAPRNINGEPHIADANFWGHSATNHPYWSPRRALDAEAVLHDSYYLVGRDGPVKKEGTWFWDRDYTSQMTQVIDSHMVGKVSHAQSEYQISPENKRIEIIDTIRADRSLYVGWHFSPSHLVTLEPDGFRFGDGQDEIAVRIEGLNGTQLQVQRRSEWKHDEYSLPLDWNETKGGPKRIAENVGYTPTHFQSEYKVRVVIQANPLK
ncbi:hypothetical protein [Aureliella helgolandensis]|uniref:hypothetical protein n=1 Tax=Aureliella helgolandensis TaxID=2527968 RepID=UPI00119EA8FF|nr:hypothetical protein [Aureliella helgolandensis]